MYELSNRNVLLGVTGGIAAYKAAELVRRLQDQNAIVRVVMTPAATEFITPLTMQALSGEPVHLDLLNPEAEAAMGHIELARWADALIVAPASADFIARVVHGHADDLLSTLYLACAAPKFIAPAMNQGMWAQSSTQNNIEALRQNGITLLGPDSGLQACGDVGAGRLLDIDQIVTQVSSHYSTGALAGLNVVVTAGPTQEAIDPVRFLSNHSSGKMGFALARAASEAGANVILVAGPVSLDCSENVQRINVKSAKEMLTATLEHMAGCDIFIATAAVADYTPLNVANNKIKKNSTEMELKLTRTEDILATVSALSPRPFCVGFAAETDQVISYAKGKLERKNLDLIVANDVSNTEIGFQSDQNKVTLVSKEQELDLPQMSKLSLAAALVEEIGQRYKNS